MVITIIVLLILAGVSITALTDKDGIINQAKDAKEKTRAAQAQEEIDIWEAKEAGDMNSDSIDALIQKLKKNGTLTQKEAEELINGGSVTIGDTTVTLGKTSWNETDEKYFVWGSNDSNSNEYYKLIGINEEYASTLPENIVIPRRCKDIYHDAFCATATGEGTVKRKIEYNTTTIELIKKIKSVKIPNTVNYIGSNAFFNCENLINIEIPNSVILVGVGAFFNCKSLTNIEIPNSVTSIGGYAFVRM